MLVYWRPLYDSPIWIWVIVYSLWIWKHKFCATSSCASWERKITRACVLKVKEFLEVSCPQSYVMHFGMTEIHAFIGELIVHKNFVVSWAFVSEFEVKIQDVVLKRYENDAEFVFKYVVFSCLSFCSGCWSRGLFRFFRFFSHSSDTSDEVQPVLNNFEALEFDSRTFASGTPSPSAEHQL
jgi:hypothetical protein